ncbi:MAG TPA: hypothetical protein VJR47_03280 [Stellaceae bacterium]|nr:hypothetical protein [Stellaceae bacterium]
MATHGSSTSRRLPREFLDFAELVRIRGSADEVDAFYGASLDALSPALLVALTERPSAA